MKITLTTERGQQVTLDLEPGENAWIATDRNPEQSSRSLYLDADLNLGTGEYDEEQAWWDWRSPLDLSGVRRNRWGQPVDEDGELLTIND